MSQVGSPEPPFDIHWQTSTNETENANVLELFTEASKKNENTRTVSVGFFVLLYNSESPLFKILHTGLFVYQDWLNTSMYSYL